MPSTASKFFFFYAAITAAGTVLGHTQMGYNLVFPALKKAPNSPGVKAARIGWMECNQGFAFIALFCIKWANHGLTSYYDKIFFAIYTVAQIWTGIAYLRAGIYQPLVLLWGIPALVGIALLL
ncbi:uncharacterized protein LY89DRAFT_685477 [Mollisia scopiformis]|uniref:Uncharacterized protein n=1 Tax=Mollisia scopiformis TaxID=149040 RepID=A0A194X8N5_MOLSC|nr:uncharacterized protein LY89DRAFT_685477 [Mollisia scopiformis]KUJ16531.1 hypothetical protein LY89DRAFT_685477 [Mollisia scopiformis]